jgi:hypothetical protein
MAEADAGETRREIRSEEEKVASNGESSMNEGEKSGNAEEIVTGGKESPVQSSSHDGEKSGDAGDVKPKESLVKKMADKIGLDVGTVMMMFK